MSLPTDPACIYIIIPVYNETEVIRHVVNELLLLGHSIIVVDDGSKNSIETALKGLPVYLLHHKVNLGQGAALQTGIEFALSNKAEYLVTFDGDGQHQSTDIALLLGELQKDQLDIVLGSRFLATGNQTIPATRKIVLQLARLINYLFSGLLLSDAHNGLRLMTANTARKIQFRENRMAHATELLSIIKRYQLNYKEIPVTIKYTSYSLKKGQTNWHGFRILFDLFLNKFSR